jgi:hypothetical protein
MQRAFAWLHGWIRRLIVMRSFWHITVVASALLFVAFAHWLRRPDMISRWGGFTCFCGLALQSRRVIRESYDPRPTSSAESSRDRSAADWGFFWIVIGTIVWALGDVPLEHVFK